jgi:hypothetical protein
MCGGSSISTGREEGEPAGDHAEHAAGDRDHEQPGEQSHQAGLGEGLDGEVADVEQQDGEGGVRGQPEQHRGEPAVRRAFGGAGRGGVQPGHADHDQRQEDHPPQEARGQP